MGAGVCGDRVPTYPVSGIPGMCGQGRQNLKVPFEEFLRAGEVMPRSNPEVTSLLGHRALWRSVSHWHWMACHIHAVSVGVGWGEEQWGTCICQGSFCLELNCTLPSAPFWVLLIPTTVQHRHCFPESSTKCLWEFYKPEIHLSCCPAPTDVQAILSMNMRFYIANRTNNPWNTFSSCYLLKLPELVTIQYLVAVN